MKQIKLSIKYRIFLLFALSMTCILSLFIILQRKVTSSVLENNLSEYLVMAIDSNADKISYDIELGPKTSPINFKLKNGFGYIIIEPDFLSDNSDVSGAIYYNDGSLLYGGNKTLSKISDKAFADSKVYKTTIDNTPYLVYDKKIIIDDTINKENDSTYWIRGIIPLTNNTKQLNMINKTLISFFPVFILIIIIVSILASYSILKPIRKMKNTAANIIDGDDLNKRIPISNSNDEIDDLAISYNKMLTRLEDSFNREKQFTSDASHELRTPLSVILNQSEFTLTHDKNLTESQKDAFAVIIRQSERMKTLIDDMLGLSRIASGGEKYPKDDLDFSSLISDICTDMSLIGYNNITLETDIEDDIHIFGNASLLERMLINLIDNAYKYGKKNGHITVNATHNSKYIIISVKDDGIGIDSENIKNIFNRFYREDSSRSEVTGYGLGLSLVSEIVKYHNGLIDVKSSKGAGSTFTLKLNSSQIND